MRFWLDRGVAGFRLDAITSCSRMQLGTRRWAVYRAGRPNLSDATKSLAEVHEVMRRLRAMTDSYAGARVLIGETYVPTTAQLDPWYGGARHDELQLPMDTLLGLGNKLDAGTFRARLIEAQSELHGSQPLFVFDNHDNVRSWNRFGDVVHDAAIARIVATLLLSSRAAALIYQGQELGQTTATPTRIDHVRDPLGITGWPKDKGRDGERTPMQWSDAAQAGFSTNAHTWLPVSTDNYPTVNAQAELADPHSLLNWYRHLIALRRSNAALRNGRTVMLDPANAQVLSFARVATNGTTVVVALNMSAEPHTISLGLGAAGLSGSQLTTLLASPDPINASAADRAVTLAPFAAWVAALR